MKTPIQKIWPWVLVVAIPLWLIAVVGELRDAQLLEREGVPTVGHMEAPHWNAGTRGGRRLRFDAVWSHAGQEYRREFSLPLENGQNFADKDGNLIESRLEMHYAPSKPEVASIDLVPPDPIWVSIILACVGFCVLCGVVVYLIRLWRRPQSRPRR